jgi:hypothetical protein
MPDAQVDSLPAFARAIIAAPLVASEGRASRLDILQREHADYAARKSSWTVLLDAFEGSGGFLDGSYLWEYPREDSSAYATRKAQARYHNYVESLVDIYVRFLFTQGVQRQSNDPELNAWLENVDGRQTKMDDLLKQLVSVSLLHGHGGVLVDKTADEPTGQTKADDKARVIASVFTALAIGDWRFTDGTLSAVKLFEAAPENAITDELPTGDDARQYLLIAADGWARFNADGELVAGAEVDLGMVPLVVLRPKPSYTSLMTGRQLMNANVVKAMQNRASEEDEVIRSQAFSVLTVSVPEGGNVEDAKSALGNTIGTAKALVVKGDIDFKTPDQSVPGAIRENIAYLVQELYRAAHVRLNKPTGDAESGESIRLQYTELNEMLQGMAKALSACERQIVRARYAWTEATPELADAAFEKAQYEATYPTEFFLDALMSDLEAWGEAIRMNLGATMTKRIKRRAVRRLDPDIPEQELKQIDDEIEAMGADDDLGLPTLPMDRGVGADGEPVNGG